MENLQPTTPYPAPGVSVPTYALLRGEWVWTKSGPREVLNVSPGVAGGWRQVRFYGTEGYASVVYAHPWTPAIQCSAYRGGNPSSGCDAWALEGSDYCAEHDATPGGA